MQYIKRLFYCFLLLPFCVFADVFVVGDTFLLNPKTSAIIEKIGDEFFQKAGISMYVVLKKDLSLNKEERRQFVLRNLTNTQNYFAILFALEDKKIDFFMSGDLENIIDVDSVYSEFMVPFLPVKKSDILDTARISAILLNGYAHFIDAFARYKNIQIQSNIIDRNGEMLAQVARVVIWVMLLSLIVGFVWIRRRRK
ncbi:hypothetical protein LW135_05955 [Helicobacter sp. faydin-H20]|uniref:hypothetical protein n=1 Tax=Helicobacter anatolicus TaxID=2905874 RepID=UPI001E2D8824|nr:hypothetical protein [Helicobacter anatolicus]MCE3037375.1 hypothetical protein [Helicobacter anatolicus]